MATTAWQVSIKFLQYGASWSENFWSLWSGTPAALAAAVGADPSRVITNFRHPGTVMTGVSVRNSASTRQSAIFLSNANPTGIINSNSPGPDLVQTALPIRITAPGGGSRTLFVRGLPDDATIRSAITGRSVYGTLQQKALEYYGTIQVNWNGAIQHIIPAPSSGAFSWQNVISIGVASDNPNWTEIILAGGSLVPAPGTLVYMRGFQNGTFTFLRGRFIVKSNPAGSPSFTIPASWRGGSAPVTVANVQARQFTYSYDGMDGGTAGQLTGRKTNDPTTKRRGRRSAAIRRRLALVG